MAEMLWEKWAKQVVNSKVSLLYAMHLRTRFAFQEAERGTSLFGKVVALTRVSLHTLEVKCNVW
jgi:hypothetical protein